MREPETLTELKAEILRQLEKSETVTIELTNGDGIHELLESLDEIENLRKNAARLQQWKKEAVCVLAEWHRTWEALGSPGTLGQSKADSVRELLLPNIRTK